ncbi:MAG TPA: hypothetical protein VGJ05_02565 [Fimbriiglobus sp.]
MRTFLVGAAVFAFAAGPAAAQAPVLAVSWDAKLPADRSPENSKATELNVRPNQSEAYYVYVYNPSEDPMTYAVIVAQGTGAGDKLAEQTVTVEPKRTLRVPFAAPAPIAGQAPAAGLAPAATPAAAPAGKAIGNQLVFRLVNPKTGKNVVQDQTLPVQILPLSSYIDPRETSFAYSRSANRLTVTLAKVKKVTADEKPKFEHPCKVKLELRPDLIRGLDKNSVLEGTFESELSENGPDTVTLIASNMRFTGENPGGLVGVSVDGVDRAIVYEVSFATDNTTGTPLTFDKSKPRLVPVGGRWVAAPGKPFPVRIEVDAVPRKDDYRIAAWFDRAGTDQALQPLLKKDSRVQNESVSAVIGGPDGGIAVHAAVSDWVVNIDTAGVIGKRKVSTAVTKPDRTLVGRDEQTLTLDRTGPVDVTLSPAARSGERGTVLKVSASGRDKESGVEKVIFFVGDAPGADGKAAPGGKVVVKKLDAATTDAVSREAELPLPDVKGRVQIGVRYVNVLGMVTDKVEEVDVVDPPKPKSKEAGATTGTIKGVIAQGGGSQIRPQPGLKVELRGPDNKAIKTTQSGEGGKYEFKDVPPGDYTVFSIKPADAGAKGDVGVSVKAGETTEAKPVFLKR